MELDYPLRDTSMIVQQFSTVENQVVSAGIAETVIQSSSS
jgi:hypothetical protein